MTPLPKRRHSTRRQGKRTASLRVGVAQATKCTNCGKLKKSHVVCPACGYYAGVQVVVPKVKKKKSE